MLKPIFKFNIGVQFVAGFVEGFCVIARKRKNG
jgi:hypothetical protein